MQQYEEPDAMATYTETYHEEDDGAARLLAYSGPYVFWGVLSVLTLGVLAIA